jgi:riboflavin kinase/FMN adenylyltransferase
MSVPHAVSLDDYVGQSDACVAIGVFDGVHRGHHRVLAQANSDAQGRGLISLALTFDPHPAALLAPEYAPRHLSTLSQRLAWMTEPGLAQVAVVAHFDRAFAALTPRQFVENVLVEKLRARQVRVGADFRFGFKRAGSVMDLESMGESHGFHVHIVHAVSRSGERVSSTGIRQLVEDGDLEHAAVLLGRPFTLRGTVVRGKQLGRTIGYPTANVEPEIERLILPADGIYAGYAVNAPSDVPIRAAISVGTNPTTDGSSNVRKVEAFLMDGFSGDLYGKQIDLRFGARVRDVARLDGIDALKSQIAVDVAEIERLIERIG